MKSPRWERLHARMEGDIARAVRLSLARRSGDGRDQVTRYPWFGAGFSHCWPHPITRAEWTAWPR